MEDMEYIKSHPDQMKEGFYAVTKKNFLITNTTWYYYEKEGGNVGMFNSVNGVTDDLFSSGQCYLYAFTTLTFTK